MGTWTGLNIPNLEYQKKQKVTLMDKDIVPEIVELYLQ